MPFCLLENAGNIRKEHLKHVYWRSRWLTNPTGIHGDGGSIPGLAQCVRDPALHELWCRSQMRLGSHVAVAPGTPRPNKTPSLGTPLCQGYGQRRNKKKKKKKKKKVYEVSQQLFLDASTKIYEALVLIKLCL